MKPNRIVIAALIASVVAIGAYAQEKPASPTPGASMHDEKGSSTKGGMKDGMMGSMMTEDKAMMDEWRKMMGEMGAAAAKLEGLVAQMNAAESTRKMDDMAIVITELVAQQNHMRQNMMSMGPGMMKHMMAHMKSGTVPGMEKSMAMCPMMQGTDASKDGEQDHTKHHPDSQK